MEDIRTLVSRYARGANGNRQWQRATMFGSLAVAEVELSRTELARAGRYVIGGNQIIANGIGVSAAIPTTTPTLGLYNGNLQDSLLLDWVTGPWLGSGTAAAGVTLLAGISTQTSAGTIPTANTTGWSSVVTSGSGTRRSAAWWNTGVTFIAASTSWFALTATQQLAAANVGQGSPSQIFLNGGIVIPPGFNIGFAFLTGAGTTPLYGLSMAWGELQVDIE
jgi:hypothetical protein